MIKSLKFSVVVFTTFLCINAQAQSYRLPSPDSSGHGNMIVYDREGNIYNVNDLKFEKNNNLGGGNSKTIQPTCDAGIFRLHFTDAGTNNGFDDPALGPQRQAVACQVFSDLSGLINEAASPYSSIANLGSGNFVEIWVQASLNDAGNPTLGTAGQYFLSTTPGIVHGTVWQTINAGIDAWFGTNSGNLGNFGIFHGQMQINFGHNFYLGNDPALISSTERDLYTVILHEAIHALGFGSLINQNGTSKITGTNPGIYSIYDTYLRESSTGNRLINTNGCYNAAFSITTTGKLTTPCTIDFNGTSSTFVSSDATWSGGTSLSHYPIGICGNPGNYVMNPSLGLGVTRRFPTTQEVTTLCDIGYSTSGAYAGTNYPTGTCGTRLAGVNDYATYTATAPGINYSTPNNTAFNFSSTDILGNDENATFYECLQVVNASGTLGGSLSGGTGNTITFTPNTGFAGVAILRYTPRLGATGVKGNTTYIFILVQPPALPACAPSQCEMVCYGGFEEFTSQLQYDQYTLGGFSTGNTFRFYPATYPDNSPDLRSGTFNWPAFFSCGTSSVISPHSGNNMVGMILRNDPFTLNNNPEGPALPLNGSILPGETVTVTVWARLASATCAGGIEVRFTNMAPCTGTTQPLLGTCPAGIVQSAVLQSAALANNTNWQQLTFNYTNVTTVSLTHLLINSLPFQVYTASPFGFVFIDDVSCIKNTPTLTITKTGSATACPNDVIPYNIEVCNTSTFPANNVQITDALSAGLTLATGGTFTYPTHTITTLAAGACQNFTVNAQVNISSGTVSNTANVSSGGCLTNTTQNTVNTNIGQPSLNITQTLSNNNPTPGSTVNLTVNVCNYNPGSVNNITIETSIPPGHTITAGTGYTVTGNVISFDPFTLGPGTITSPTCSTFVIPIIIGCAGTSGDICTTILTGGNVCTDNDTCNTLTVNNNLFSITQTVSVGTAPINSDINGNTYAGQLLTYHVKICNNTGNTVNTSVDISSLPTGILLYPASFSPASSPFLCLTNATPCTSVPLTNLATGCHDYYFSLIYTTLGEKEICMELDNPVCGGTINCCSKVTALQGCPGVNYGEVSDCSGTGKSAFIASNVHKTTSNVVGVKYYLYYPSYLTPVTPNTFSSPFAGFSGAYTPITCPTPPCSTPPPPAGYNKMLVEVSFNERTINGNLFEIHFTTNAPPPTSADINWVESYSTGLPNYMDLQIVDDFGVAQPFPILTQNGTIIVKGNCYGTNNPNSEFTIQSSTCSFDASFAAVYTSPTALHKWEFGDGLNTPLLGAGPNVDYTYLAPGTYTVTHTVIENGYGSVTTHTITITEPAYDYPYGLTISSASDVFADQNGDNKIIVKGPVYIESGVTYTINNKVVEFARDLMLDPTGDLGIPLSGIIVKNNATLTLNNNTVLKGTSECSNLWDGVQVWGDPAGTQQTQYRDGELTVQPIVYVNENNLKNGKLIMNNATIQDAYVGVRTYRTFGFVYNPPDYGRGIIEATSSRFTNNGIGVMFNCRFPRNNKSFITSCAFTSNSSHLLTGADKFISLTNVKTVSITGNTFTGNTALAENNRATGIYSYNSSYTVESTNRVGNVYSLNPRQNVFTGLTKGIDAHGTGGVVTNITIRDNTFSNTLQAITVQSSNFGEIHQNTFNVPAKIGSLDTYGVYALNAKGYKVHNNNFNGSGTDTYGVIANNTTSFGAEVVANKFTNINIGTQTENVNQALKIKCNEYRTNNTGYGILVNPNTLGSLNSQGTGCGVKSIQADNSFYISSCSGNKNQILSTIEFNYYNNTANTGAANAGCVGKISSGGTITTLTGFQDCNSVPPSPACNAGERCNSQPCYELEIRRLSDPVEKQLLTNELIRFLLKNGQEKEAVETVERINSEEARKMLVPTYLERLEISKAETVLSLIPAANNENENFRKLNNVHLDLYKKDRSVREMTSPQKQQVETVADANTNSSLSAQGILTVADEKRYVREPQKLSVSSARMGSSQSEDNTETPGVLGNSQRIDGLEVSRNFITIVPNPAQAISTINYSLENMNNGQLVIYDIFGKVVRNEKLNTSTGSVQVDLNDLAGGIYHCVINSANAVVLKDRLVIIK